MEYEILYRPSYSLLRIKLNPGESIQAEAGAMVSMKNVEMETKAKGSLFKSLTRSMLGGETFFVNTFKASTVAGEVTFAPSYAGDIIHLSLANQTVYAQSGSYIASSPNIEIDTKWTGARGFFSGEGLFLLKIQGSGDLFLSSYGAIHEVTLTPNEKYMVDTGHMVAFTEGVNYSVKRVGGLKSTLFSGEGLVCEFVGSGKIYIQSRSLNAFLSWLIPQLPTK